MVKTEVAYEKFMRWLAKGRPFTFVRFNDGEMSAIARKAKVIARKDQEVTESLVDALVHALGYRMAGRYWIGGPCPKCFPSLNRLFRESTSGYPSTAPATTFCNEGRWPRFIRDSFKALKDKRIVSICGKGQKMKELMELIQPKDLHIERVPDTDSFRCIEGLRRLIGLVPDGSVVLLTCGPVGRIVAQEGCERRPNVTWLDIGSAYDPLTRNVWHRCHLGTLPKCVGCNT